MKKFITAVFLAVCLTTLSGFSGCATPTTATSTIFDITSVQRNVYAAKEAYGVAERLATAYASLGRCATPAVQPCSDPVVVAQITKARNIARDSLEAAQTAADTPRFGSDIVSTAVTAMNASLSAFQSITTKYGSK